MDGPGNQRDWKRSKVRRYRRIRDQRRRQDPNGARLLEPGGNDRSVIIQLIMSPIAKAAPAWTIPGFLEARENNHLFISGADATALSYQDGTPLFVFSEPRIRANISRLQAAAKKVDRPIKFCYASKANSNMAVLGIVRDAGIDIEVNSGGELFKALRAGFRPDQIIFNGTSKSDDEIDDAVRAGIYAINIDSIYEIELVEQSVERLRARGEDVAPARITDRKS